MNRADLYTNLLIDLGEYNSHLAHKIYVSELKHCKSDRERNIKCYLILEKRRREIGLAPIGEEVNK